MYGDYLKSRSFKTLYDRVAGKQLRFLVGDDGLMRDSHDLLKKAACAFV